MTLYFSQSRNDQQCTLYPNAGINVMDCLKFDYMPCLVEDSSGLKSSRAGSMESSTFLKADCIVLDYDEGKTIEEFFEENYKYEFYLFTTRNHQKAKSEKPACDRFRVIFPIEEITDREQYENLLNDSIEKFGSDPGARGFKRFFYASPDNAEFYHNPGTCWLYGEKKESLEDRLFREQVEEEELDCGYTMPREKITANRNNELKRYAGHIKNEFTNEVEFLARLCEFNKKYCDPPLSEKEIRLTILKSTAREVKREQSRQRLENQKREEASGEEQQKEKSSRDSEQGSKADQERKQKIKLDLTDIGNARLLKKWYGKELRFLSESRRWIAFDGKKWSQYGKDEPAWDAVEKMSDRYEKMVWKLTDEEKQILALKNLEKMKSSKGTSAILQKASAMFRASWRDFDKKTNRITLQNGTYDLDERKFYDDQFFASDMSSKIADVKYDENIKSDLWTKAVSSIFCEDAEVIKYMQKSLGRCLSGNLLEHDFTQCVGEGRNGKRIILQTIKEVLGEYAIESSPDNIQEQRNGQRTEFLAAWNGRRMIVLSEGSKGKKANIALIKSLTGGDEIEVRELYGMPYRIKPSFKIFYMTNVELRIDDDSRATRERMKYISFNREFLRDDPQTIPDLDRQLLSEENKSAILNWLIEGYYLYKKEGLTAPASIQRDTDEYLDDGNMLKQFVDEKIQRTGNDFEMIKCKTVYDEYVKFCAHRSIPINMTRFGKNLKNIYKIDRTEKQYYAGSIGKFYRGIRLVSEYEAKDFTRNDDGYQGSEEPAYSQKEFDDGIPL